jgi:hypothetical protein
VSPRQRTEAAIAKKAIARTGEKHARMRTSGKSYAYTSRRPDPSSSTPVERWGGQRRRAIACPGERELRRGKDRSCVRRKSRAYTSREVVTCLCSAPIKREGGKETREGKEEASRAAAPGILAGGTLPYCFWLVYLSVLPLRIVIRAHVFRCSIIS